MIKKMVVAMGVWAACSASQAALVVINPVSDLITQAEFAAKYAQAAAAYSNQILQYEMMLKNLLEHPLGVVMPNIATIVNNVAKLMANGKSIGDNMSKISVKLDKLYSNEDPNASYADKFKVLSDSSDDALKAAMLNAGLHREQFKDDTSALQALITKNAASSGALAAMKTLGEIATAQLQESLKLRDLITAQQMATNEFLLAQHGAEKASLANNQALQEGTALRVPTTIPGLDTSAKTYQRWNLYPTK